MKAMAVGTTLVTFAEALRQGPPPAGNLAVPIFRHGSLEVEMYAPQGADLQKPHGRDEVYVVARGTSDFSTAVTAEASRPDHSFSFRRDKNIGSSPFRRTSQFGSSSTVLSAANSERMP
jgi:hypothetical protein